MEYGLRPEGNTNEELIGLNPCCNGIWSQTLLRLQWQQVHWVLILVVMEYGLRHGIFFKGP